MISHDGCNTAALSGPHLDVFTAGGEAKDGRKPYPYTEIRCETRSEVVLAHFCGSLYSW